MSQTGETTTEGEALAQISDALVHLHKLYYGKGPTRAKSFFVDDTVLCLLRGGLTIVEQTLVDVGKEQAVQDIRRSFQAAMADRFTSLVEEILGRKVVAYMSQVHVDPDISAELFVLEPAVENGAPVVTEIIVDAGDSTNGAKPA